MSRTVELGPRKVEILEPWEAGEFDPPMQDWLQLPVGDGCPYDHSHERWGTRNPCGYFLVRYCKECNQNFRGDVTAHTVMRIVGALTGEPVRLARS